MHVADWVAEEQEVHLLPHLKTALARADSPLRLLTMRVDPDGILALDMAWSGPPASSRDWRAAVFALVGGIAECSTHVRQWLRDDGTVFDVVTGMLPGDGPFAEHGHSLRLRVVGAREKP